MLRRFLQFFLLFFSKKYAVLSILWSKFLLKTRFQMTVKSVLMCPKGLRPGAHATICPPVTPLQIRHFDIVLQMLLHCFNLFARLLLPWRNVAEMSTANSLRAIAHRQLNNTTNNNERFGLITIK